MNRIKQLREKKGITQEKLGQLIGVQSSAISKYEKGIVPLTDDTIRDLCKIFDVSSDYLICNDTELSNEILEIEVLKKALQKVGFMENDEDMTDEELDKVMKFVSANKDFLKGNK